MSDLAQSPYAALQRLAQVVEDQAGFPVKSVSMTLYVKPKVWDQLAENSPELVQKGNRPGIHIAMGDNDLEITVDPFARDDEETEKSTPE